METQRQKVKAADLKAGMRLASGGTVKTAPTAGLSTPRGKVDLVILYADGEPRLATWRRETEIAVISDDSHE